MGIPLKRLWANIARELMRPLKRLEKKVKQAAQSFVLKAVAQHGRNVAAPAEIACNTAQFDPLLLAFLRSGQRSSRLAHTRTSSLPFNAVPISTGRLMAWHPHADFVYADTNDHRTTALIAAGRYDVALSAKLESLVTQGSCVYILGDPVGFHTLSLSRLVGADGTVVALDANDSELKKLNFDANLCRNIVSCMGHDNFATLPPELLIVRIERSPDSMLNVVEKLITHHPHTQVVLHLFHGNLSDAASIGAMIECIAKLSGSHWQPSQYGLRCQPPTLGDDGRLFNWSEPWVFIPEVAPSAQRKAA